MIRSWSRWKSWKRDIGTCSKRMHEHSRSLRIDSPTSNRGACTEQSHVCRFDYRLSLISHHACLACCKTIKLMHACRNQARTFANTWEFVKSKCLKCRTMSWSTRSISQWWSPTTRNSFDCRLHSIRSADDSLHQTHLMTRTPLMLLWWVRSDDCEMKLSCFLWKRVWAESWSHTSTRNRERYCPIPYCARVP